MRLARGSLGNGRIGELDNKYAVRVMRHLNNKEIFSSFFNVRYSKTFVRLYYMKTIASVTTNLRVC